MNSVCLLKKSGFQVFSKGFVYKQVDEPMGGATDDGSVDVDLSDLNVVEEGSDLSTVEDNSSASKIGKIASMTAGAMLAVQALTGCAPTAGDVKVKNPSAQMSKDRPPEGLPPFTVDTYLMSETFLEQALYFEKIRRLGLFKKGPFTLKDYRTRLYNPQTGGFYEGKVDVTITEDGMGKMVAKDGGVASGIELERLVMELEMMLVSQKDCKEEGRAKCTTVSDDINSAIAARSADLTADDADDHELIERTVTQGGGIVLSRDVPYYGYHVSELAKALNTAGVLSKRVLLFHGGKPVVVVPSENRSEVYYLDGSKDQFNDEAGRKEFLNAVIPLVREYTKDVLGFPLSANQEKARNSFEGGKYKRGIEIPGVKVSEMQNAMDKVGMSAFYDTITIGGQQRQVGYKAGESALYTNDPALRASLSSAELDKFFADHTKAESLTALSQANFAEAFSRKYNLKLVTDKVPNITGVKANVIKDKLDLFKKLQDLPMVIGKFSAKMRAKWGNMNLYVVSDLADQNGALKVKRQGNSIALDINSSDFEADLYREIFLAMNEGNNDLDELAEKKAEEAGAPGKFYSRRAAWAGLPGSAAYADKYKVANADRAGIAVNLLDSKMNVAFREKMKTDAEALAKGQLITGLKFDTKTGLFTDAKLGKADLAKYKHGGSHYFGGWSEGGMGKALWNNPDAATENESVSVDPKDRGLTVQVKFKVKKAPISPMDRESQSENYREVIRSLREKQPE